LKHVLADGNQSAQRTTHAEVGEKIAHGVLVQVDIRVKTLERLESLNDLNLNRTAILGLCHINVHHVLDLVEFVREIFEGREKKKKAK
jgi:hypothetical protein